MTSGNAIEDDWRMAEFSGEAFSDADLGRLLDLDQIHSLSLYDTAVTDSGIEALRNAATLQELHITSDYITDLSMVILCGLPGLRSLLISRAPRITDGGMKHVLNATNLRELYLAATQVTDRGLQNLRGLSNLWSLCLDDTEVTDDGIRLLRELPVLQLLCVNRTKLAGTGLVELANNEHLGLYLSGTPASDEGVLAFAAALTNIKDLDLSGTKITDQSANAFGKLPKLNVLRLAETRITDITLSVLEGHSSLQAIDLRGTSVTDIGVRALKKASRRLTVYLD